MTISKKRMNEIKNRIENMSRKEVKGYMPSLHKSNVCPAQKEVLLSFCEDKISQLDTQAALVVPSEYD